MFKKGYMPVIPALIIVIMAMAAGLSSCISDDITTSPGATLTFSREDVDFGTIFTGEGSTTARLVVHNRAKKGVNISSIRVEGGTRFFRINVDGVSGENFSDVEIRGNDSIYIFVECLIPENNDNKPFAIDDRLEFVTNGVTQTLPLKAEGQNVWRLKGQTLTADTRLTADRPYIIYDSLRVERGVTLTIEPGSRVYFHDGAGLSVEGCLNAVGAPGAMITMGGDRLDNVLPDVSYEILAGQWRGVRIGRESFGNLIEYVDMHSTQRGLEVDSCGDYSRRKLLLRNSWLHNSQGTVLESKYAWVDAEGVCFSEASRAVVSLYGGVHNFNLCTLANNYLFSAISEPLLSLYHIKEGDDLAPYPLMRMEMTNSIIYGLASDLNVDVLDETDVWLRYVSLKSNGSNDEHFVACLWDTDPLFETVRSDYYFNYHLKADSPVLHAADGSYIGESAAMDMDGIGRFANGAPALGAYAWLKPKEEAEVK